MLSVAVLPKWNKHSLHSYVAIAITNMYTALTTYINTCTTKLRTYALMVNTVHTHITTSNHYNIHIIYNRKKL